MAGDRPVDGPRFPPELRDPSLFGSRFDWHSARCDWLQEHGLKGLLTELRAMVHPHIAQRLVEDPGASIGGARRP